MKRSALWITLLIAASACSTQAASSPDPAATPTGQPTASARVAPVGEPICVGRNDQMVDVPEPARGYGAAWNEQDEIVRLVILERIWAKKAVNIQPDLEMVVGRQAFSDHIGAFQASRPGDYFEWRVWSADWSPGYLHHDRVVMYWRICSADDDVVLEGTTFGRIDRDGRLVEATAFYLEG